jgi:hypothetical protein
MGMAMITKRRTSSKSVSHLKPTQYVASSMYREVEVHVPGRYRVYCWHRPNNPNDRLTLQRRKASE